ncbi:Phosphoacetylglucosamine mutase [Hondaea fermentalgiana]|uniref:Phosphoacetylglucosamine mutase n=1 Tax=Hondaea fermentalgiana TaxID=2315210 RepID=A0A2R5GYI6_9STRA|nr:Phosphoacetylglucosamine mutase [Hondaea fermentalgiana]|eukprot:GBG33793.1 Phosphoacetylglucosamine mutase [Hondaea fermentalgiana]
MSSMKEAVTKLAAAHPRAQGAVYRYGTAGFREAAEVLDAVFVRVGMLSWVRALSTRANVGLMVTASHNPHRDNGVKLVDPDGGMLSQSWESFATDLCNAQEDKVADVLERICNEIGVDLAAKTPSDIHVFVGWDTRTHSPRLADLAAQGIESVGGAAERIGVVTTPILHHCVRSSNMPEEAELASVEGYRTKLGRAFATLVRTAKPSPAPQLVVDAAFGVGGPCFEALLASLDNEVRPKAEIRNVPTGEAAKAQEEADKLNNGVGAEHVQKKLLFPEQVPNLPDERGVRCCSFDGDADRIVYYRAMGESDSLNLFDGDKIACLYTYFIQMQMAALPDALTSGVKVGCIQTAYANGASTEYITKKLKVDAPRTKTGVKHLHHKAVEYDVGVYFEANGHGTVLFGREFISRLREAAPGLEDDATASAAVETLLALEQLINQATGDAMADLLAVEAILRADSMSLDDWDGFYTDLPSRQLKCQVADRTAIKTSDDESRVLEPASLQDAIDSLVAQYKSGRAFARPSGTEDAVRVYAEADTSAAADELATKVLQAVFDHAGGVGERPN